MGFAGIGGAQYGGDISDLRHHHKVDAKWLMSTGGGGFSGLCQFAPAAKGLDSKQNIRWANR
jgi:hypothetical protein